MRGQFITLEGGEGVGKSTNLTFLRGLFSDAGIPFVDTREPGGTRFGEALRGVLLGDEADNIAPDAELLAIFAARAEHLDKVIKPALERGEWVLCDRFTDATFAYQGGGRNLPFERIAVIEQWVQQGLQPDLTLLLDAPIEVGMQRAAKRAVMDRFEQEPMDFFQAVRNGYLKRVDENPKRFSVIDASQPLVQVQAQLTQAIAPLIQQWRVA